MRNRTSASPPAAANTESLPDRQFSNSATVWAGCAAVWAFVFAAISFYWAADGAIGLETQAESIQQRVRSGDAGFIALLWATGALKLIGGLLAVALVQPWARAFPRRLLLLAAWAAGTGMALWGGLNLLAGAAVALLRAAGAIDAPAKTSAFWWHLVLWDPFWLAGGALFCAAAWHYQRRSVDRVLHR